MSANSGSDSERMLPGAPSNEPGGGTMTTRVQIHPSSSPQSAATSSSVPPPPASFGGSTLSSVEVHVGARSRNDDSNSGFIFPPTEIQIDPDTRNNTSSGNRQTANVPGSSPAETESPGTSQLSPPPSYHDIPGTVPAHQGVSRGPPPSYEDAVDPNAAEPPSYDSLFGRIRDTHKTSRNLVDFLVKVLILLLGTIGCTIACSVTVIIPLGMIIVGSIYFDECPAEPHIPVFLIVGGSFAVFKYLIGVMTRIRRGAAGREDGGGDDNSNNAQPIQTLITCFLCGWFISGCVWVYRIYRPNMDESASDVDPNYCNRTVYIFAFWLITTAYIFLGLFTSCICCFSIVSVILKRE